MIELIVKNGDGNVVVTGNYPNMESVKAWIENEKLGTWLKPDYTFEYVSKDPVPLGKQSADLDQAKVKDAARRLANSEFLAADISKMGINEVKELLIKLQKAWG